MMKAISKHIFIPLLERYAGKSTIKRLSELERTQWMSPEELAGLQEKRLREIIKHAYHNVPYYFRIFGDRGLKPEDIRTVEDLGKLPVLTREDVRNNFTDLMAQNCPKKQMTLLSTGGTTGEPLRYYHPKDSGWTWGAFWRGMHWYGVEFGDKKASIGGHAFNPTITDRLRTRVSKSLTRIISQSAFEMSPEQLEHFVNRLRKFRPSYLGGYSSALYILSKYIMEQGINDIRPRVIITTAEKLYDYQREAIRQAFDCDVFEYYGGGEVLSIAYECPEHQGLHITSENVVIEIIKNGKNVSLGETGAVLVTDLHNYAMPFIRYQNGDIGILSDKTCPCGRGLPLIKSLEGRITDVIVHKNGFVSTPILTLIFKNLPVRQYQIIQETRDKILIKVIKDDEYSQKDTDHIVGTMRRYIGENTELQVEFVDSIPLAPSGKHRVVISKVPVKF